MMKVIDDFLNGITMYRLLFYYLILLWLGALAFSIFHLLPYDPLALLFSLVLVLAVSWVVNLAFSKSFEAATNVESVYITSLIIALIMNPVAPTNTSGVGVLVFASAWAMGSKYLFAVDRKHFFNPAALGVALVSLTMLGSATWWVGGNIPLLPVVLVGGLLVVRKVRRFDLVLTFLAVAAATILATAPAGANVAATLQKATVHTPLFFFAFVMLTEPFTMPGTRGLRLVYAAIVAVLFAPNVHIGSYYFAPEFALLVGNLFTFIVSQGGRFTLTLVDKRVLAPDVFEYVFTPDHKVRFHAGQYLEWTIQHSPKDARGNRRYFTIASSPTENEIRLGVKFYPHPSSFKTALENLKVGDTITATQLAGDFTLPHDRSRKLAFFAGGIGITPFRSQVQYLMDSNDNRDVALFYANKAGAEVAYKDFFDTAAEKMPLKNIYTDTLDQALIQKELPDYKDRAFYLSGPPGMVDAYKKTLRQMGVPRLRIVTDYFPGLA